MYVYTYVYTCIYIYIYIRIVNHNCLLEGLDLLRAGLLAQVEVLDQEVAVP